MLSLSEQKLQRPSARRWVIFLLACVIAVAFVPRPGTSLIVHAQGDGAATDSATTDTGGSAGDSAPSEVQTRNFLMWMMDALGWFWMLIFAALSFVMVALVMMNLLQVRRDVLAAE